MQGPRAKSNCPGLVEGASWSLGYAEATFRGCFRSRASTDCASLAAQRSRRSRGHRGRCLNPCPSSSGRPYSTITSQARANDGCCDPDDLRGIAAEDGVVAKRPGMSPDADLR
jgi:hypothetical protein